MFFYENYFQKDSKIFLTSEMDFKSQTYVNVTLGQLFHLVTYFCDISKPLKYLLQSPDLPYETIL